jgi:hypothetical protein
MYNEYVTQEFTIRDLLTQSFGAGDLMIWPDGSNFTATDIIQNLQFQDSEPNMIMTTYYTLC